MAGRKRIRVYTGNFTKKVIKTGITEHDIQSNIQLELSKRGYCVFRINVGKVKTADGRWFDCGTPQGYSDLTIIKLGKVFFVEVKKPGGHVRQDQIHFLKVMKEKYGCHGGIAYSVEDAIEICEGKVPESNKKWFKE